MNIKYLGTSASANCRTQGHLTQLHSCRRGHPNQPSRSSEQSGRSHPSAEQWSTFRTVGLRTGASLQEVEIWTWIRHFFAWRIRPPQNPQINLGGSVSLSESFSLSKEWRYIKPLSGTKKSAKKKRKCPDITADIQQKNSVRPSKSWNNKSTLVRLPLPQCFCLRGTNLRPWSEQNSDPNSDSVFIGEKENSGLVLSCWGGKLRPCPSLGCFGGRGRRGGSQ